MVRLIENRSKAQLRCPVPMVEGAGTHVRGGDTIEVGGMPIRLNGLATPSMPSHPPNAPTTSPMPAMFRLIETCSSSFSQRHACRLVDVDRKTVRRVPPADASEICQTLCALADERRRFGYRRLGALLARAGITINAKKLYRLYRWEGLTVRRRRGRKRTTGARAPAALPQGPRSRRDCTREALGPRRRHLDWWPAGRAPPAARQRPGSVDQQTPDSHRRLW